MIKTQYHIIVHNIRSDNGQEYIINKFQSKLNKGGILQTTPCAWLVGVEVFRESLSPSKSLYNLKQSPGA